MTYAHTHTHTIAHLKFNIVERTGDGQTDRFKYLLMHLSALSIFKCGTRAGRNVNRTSLKWLLNVLE